MTTNPIILSLPTQTISDRDDDDAAAAAQDFNEIPSAHAEPAEEEPETEDPAKMDLEAFLSQFILIKTPYGYILARAPQHEPGMSRSRRGRSKAESNFQLRVRKSGDENRYKL